ncbi:helix-turn-helix domain-containing protein [Limosilactobacillus portuensis]|uniref:Helix-turn-helix domain-containing protein n=1 Tax=Limosilactobacillus portuensis TaxID=2742601 RepID=A0ABS6ITQ1_9LACO|nr:helix-turn-helix domain-containing protein [Limosilactobacillus portuensis]MBU9694366.1 helix-turn-helix domain-containing protein [Limosilactobacillus portuensis]
MIKVNLGVVMEKRGISSKELAKGIRFATLNKLCQILNCQPGDILSYDQN